MVFVIHCHCCLKTLEIWENKSTKEEYFRLTPLQLSGARQSRWFNEVSTKHEKGLEKKFVPCCYFQCTIEAGTLALGSPSLCPPSFASRVLCYNRQLTTKASLITQNEFLESLKTGDPVSLLFFSERKSQGTIEKHSSRCTVENERDLPSSFSTRLSVTAIHEKRKKSHKKK